MKSISIILMMGMALAAFSCKSEQKKETVDIIAPKFEMPKLSPPIRMQEHVQTDEFSFAGGTMKSVIVSRADDSIAIVKDAAGQEYVDNRVTVSVTRTNGEVFFKRSFTKADFNAYLTEAIRKEGVLEGITFFNVVEDTAFFGACVSIPQTDEFIPLMITLTKDAKISIATDTQMGTEIEE